MWAANGNSNNFTFWLVAYIYSTPGLLVQIRDEIDPFVTLAGHSISTLYWESIVSENFLAPPVCYDGYFSGLGIKLNVAQQLPLCFDFLGEELANWFL